MSTGTNNARKVTIGHRKLTLKDHEYQRKDGLFCYWYYDDRHRRKVITASTLDSLREKESKLEEDLQSGIILDKRMITLDDVYKEWIKTKGKIRETTLSNYISLYNMGLKDEFGNVPIREIEKADVRNFMQRLLDDEEYSFGTVKKIKQILGYLYTFAAKAKYTTENPTLDVLSELRVKDSDAPKEDNIAALTKKEQERFLSFLEESKKFRHYFPILAFQLGTGLRVSEIAGLQWGDITPTDGDGYTVHIRHNLVRFYDNESKSMKRKMHKPKTASGDRAFPLSSLAVKAIRIQEEYRKKPSSEIAGYDNYVFINKEGGTYSQQTINNAISRIVNAANLDALKKNREAGNENIPYIHDITSHVLRKTFVTRCAEAGVDIKVVSRIVGHQDIKVTYEIYTAVQQDWAAEEMKSLDAYLAGNE